jgi:hypothetical protein
MVMPSPSTGPRLPHGVDAAGKVVDGGALDPSGEPIDQPGRALEYLKIRALGPGGEVRDRVVLRGHAKRANARVCDRLGDELLTGVVQRRVTGLAIVANKRVSELVAQRLHTLVRRQAVVDDDPIGRRLVVAVRTRDRRERDGAANLLGESDEARDDRGELLAFDVPDRWIEGRWNRGRRDGRDLIVGLSRDSTDRIRSLCVSGEGEAGGRGGSVRG